MSWLNKASGFASKVTESLPDSVKQEIDHAVGEVVGDLGKVDLGDTVAALKTSGTDCNRIAKETCELCSSTIAKSTEMVEFGQEIKATLGKYEGGMDASAFETVKDLIDGDKMKAAMALASQMDDLALACVDKSVEMISSMERGVHSLPDVVERRIDEAARNGAQDDDPKLPNIEPQIRELETCIKAVKQVNLFTAMEAGLKAFDGLTKNGEICKSMFMTIKQFAEALVSITGAFTDFDISAVVARAKDLWRCIRLSDLMKSFAEQVGKLIRWIITLFKESSGKLSGIWSALAYAKDCMADCVQDVVEARQLCCDAIGKSMTLISTTKSIKGQLESVRSVDRESINALQKLSDGDEIKLAIDLATNMDDLVSTSMDKVVSMTNRVTEGYENFPQVIKEGVPDVAEAGKSDDDPEPADVGEDIEDLERCRSAIDDADALDAVKAGVDGFSGVANKVDNCKTMLMTTQGFADNCKGAIESFMGVWDLDTAMSKVLEMCRLAKLGDMMKQFVEQIRKLVNSVIALLNTAKEKISNLSFADVAGKVQDEIQGAVEEVKDVVGDVTDMAKKMKFW